MTAENDNERQTKSQGKKPEEQSTWGARLGRKSSEKIKFKFLVKLRR
jgi:hypothetical protein